MKKLLAILLVFTIVLTALVGCTKAAEPAAAGTDEPAAMKVGYMSATASTGFWKEVTDSIKATCEDRGIELVYSETSAETDKMRLAFDTFVAQGCNIILDGNSLSDIIAPFAAEAAELGIPYVTLECHVDGAYFYGISNPTCGEAVGEFLVDLVGKEWNGEADLVILNAPWTTAREICTRVTRALDLLQEAYPNLKEVDVVETDFQMDPTVAYQTCMDALTAYPNAEHILYISFTDATLLNALGAMETSGRSAQIIATGCDCQEEMVTIFKDVHDNGAVSPIRGSVYLATNTYGDRIIDLATKIYNGEDVPMENVAPVYVVSADTVYDWFE